MTPERIQALQESHDRLAAYALKVASCLAGEGETGMAEEGDHLLIFAFSRMQDSPVKDSIHEVNDDQFCAASEGCPRCGERDHDRLAWDEDGDKVACHTCGQEYDPNSGMNP